MGWCGGLDTEPTEADVVKVLHTLTNEVPKHTNGTLVKKTSVSFVIDASGSMVGPDQRIVSAIASIGTAMNEMLKAHKKNPNKLYDISLHAFSTETTFLTNINDATDGFIPLRTDDDLLLLTRLTCKA